MFCCMRASVSGLLALLVLWIFHKIYSFIQGHIAAIRWIWVSDGRHITLTTCFTLTQVIQKKGLNGTFGDSCSGFLQHRRPTNSVKFIANKKLTQTSICMVLTNTLFNKAQTSSLQASSIKTCTNALTYQLPFSVFRNDRYTVNKYRMYAQSTLHMLNY